MSSPAHAGNYGRALLDGEGEGLAVEPWQVALGIGFTLAALLYIGRVAKTVRAVSSFFVSSYACMQATWGFYALLACHGQALDEEEASPEDA